EQSECQFGIIVADLADQDAERVEYFTTERFAGTIDPVGADSVREVPEVQVGDSVQRGDGASRRTLTATRDERVLQLPEVDCHQRSIEPVMAVLVRDDVEGVVLSCPVQAASQLGQRRVEAVVWAIARRIRPERSAESVTAASVAVQRQV